MTYYTAMKRLIFAVVFSILFSFSVAPFANSNDLDYQKTVDAHTLIGLSEARDLGYDGSGQIIVIIDDGNQINHPYLKDVIIDGNCTSRATCGVDYLNPGLKAGGAHKGDGFHGSMVTGIIAGQANADAPGGIAPKAKVISIDNTDGNTEGLISAIDWILEIKKKHNVVALSASIGAPNSSGARGGPGSCSPGSDLEKKLKELIAAGISVVFAAGNGGSFTKLDYPACISDLIAVGALTHQGSIAEYSNVSQGITVMAPADIKSSNGSSGYFIGGGTSSATPVVAGAVALLKQANPDATPAEIKKALQTSRKTVDDLVWGNLPVLDIPKALEVIKTGVFDPRKIVSISGGTISPQYQALEKQYQDSLKEIQAVKIESERAISLAKEVKAKAEADAKAAKEAQVKAEAESKAMADAKSASDAELASAKLALASASAELAKWKPITITCVKGKVTKKVTAVNAKCPTGYSKK